MYIKRNNVSKLVIFQLCHFVFPLWTFSWCVCETVSPSFLFILLLLLFLLFAFQDCPLNLIEASCTKGGWDGVVVVVVVVLGWGGWGGVWAEAASMFKNRVERRILLGRWEGGGGGGGDSQGRVVVVVVVVVL